MHRAFRARRGSLPAAILAIVIALSVAFLPFAIDKVRARRSAKAIRIVASEDTAPASVGDNACRPPDETSAAFIADTRRLATNTDSASSRTRAGLGIPRADSSSVVLVSQSEVCRKVVSAINASLPAGWSAPPPTSVYVATVGPMYLALVPSPPDGTTRVYAVVDSLFRVVNRYTR
jgi:hypothetical protein